MAGPALGDIRDELRGLRGVLNGLMDHAAPVDAAPVDAAPAIEARLAALEARLAAQPPGRCPHENCPSRQPKQPDEAGGKGKGKGKEVGWRAEPTKTEDAGPAGKKLLSRRATRSRIPVPVSKGRSAASTATDGRYGPDRDLAWCFGQRRRTATARAGFAAVPVGLGETPRALNSHTDPHIAWSLSFTSWGGTSGPETALPTLGWHFRLFWRSSDGSSDRQLKKE